MLNIIEKSEVSTQQNGNHVFRTVVLKTQEFNSLVSGLVRILPDHYIDSKSFADILKRLGKAAAAKSLEIKIPQTKKMRSGDIGEAITTDYIEDYTDFVVPIRKLRYRDSREMAMRGDDVIGIYVNKFDQTIRFLKAEAKSRKSLSTSVLQDARNQLDKDDGLPSPHALSFVIERLKEMGNIQLAHPIEKAQLIDGINENKVEHLLFTFTGSNPETLQKKIFSSYAGTIKQTSIGFQVSNHQDLISEVYRGIIDDINS